MKPLVIANWKCNPTILKEAKRLFNSVKNGIKNIKNVEVVICPPFVYLPALRANGAQDCFWKEKGAFTGEVSPSMLKDIGCQYVIIGHSERRTLGETDQMINRKLKAALKEKLKPIFCLGETQQEREKGQTSNILESQIEKGLKKISKQEIKNLIIAYEPVWAIGTGNPCDIDTAQTMGLLIRKIITKLYSLSISENLRILYGGSVDRKNATDYVKEARLQGLLVGGASLDPKEFVQLIKNVSKT